MPIALSPALTSDAAGYYATQADMEDRYDAGNIAAWSNLSGNTTTPDTATIQAALDDSDLLIDETLRRNGFRYPLATTSYDFPRMTDIAVDMAVCKLLDKRILRAEPPDGMGREVFFKIKNSRERLRSLIMGGLDGTTFSDDPGHPVPLG